MLMISHISNIFIYLYREIIYPYNFKSAYIYIYIIRLGLTLCCLGNELRGYSWRYSPRGICGPWSQSPPGSAGRGHP